MTAPIDSPLPGSRRVSFTLTLLCLLEVMDDARRNGCCLLLRPTAGQAMPQPTDTALSADPSMVHFVLPMPTTVCLLVCPSNKPKHPSLWGLNLHFINFINAVLALQYTDAGECLSENTRRVLTITDSSISSIQCCPFPLKRSPMRVNPYGLLQLAQPSMTYLWSGQITHFKVERQMFSPIEHPFLVHVVTILSQ